MALLGAVSAQGAAPVPLAILHTNDLHSHFRPEKTPLSLGGLARLKTAITRSRAASANSLLVDGGDWSEGNIYYTEGAGRETLRMMDHLGYDVAVVGNHDWLNGADVLLKILSEANPSFQLVASNIQTKDYPREAEFRRRIPPYVIKNVGGAKVAFIGLVTYEFIYDRFLKPIDIKEPFLVARRLAHELKKQADVVIAISHNSIKVNKAILTSAPELDLVVGAHDHVKLTEPVIVNRSHAKPAWIVETGCWGRYLGQVELLIHPRDPNDPKSEGSVDSISYRLQQMDSSVPEDQETLRQIASLEANIEAKRGPIFHDHVGDSEIELFRTGQENLIANFAADSYLEAAKADLAIDTSNFIYNEIHRGSQTTADVYNANPGVYGPLHDRAWTLHLLPITGKNLKRILSIMYTSKTLSRVGGVALSGAEVIFSPTWMVADRSNPLEDLQMLDQAFEARLGGLNSLLDSPGAFANEDLATSRRSAIGSFKVRGEEVKADRTYIMAASGGVIEALQFLSRLIPSLVPMERMTDTGLEDWRLMAAHLRAHSPLTLDKVPYGRVHTVQSDLAVLSDDLSWSPEGKDAHGRVLAKISVRVRNVGVLSSPTGSVSGGPRVRLFINQNGVNYALPEINRDVAPPRFLPSIASGKTVTLTWDRVALPETMGVYALTALLEGNSDGDMAEVNHSNDQAIRYFVENSDF